MRIPQFDPINTVQDLIYHNITIFEVHYMFDHKKDWYFSFNISELDHVANTMVPADTECWLRNGTQICADVNGTYEYFIKHHLHGNKTHAIISGYLFSADLAVMPEKSKWWRSKKLEWGKNPYGGVFTSRNWILNEVNLISLN